MANYEPIPTTMFELRDDFIASVVAPEDTSEPTGKDNLAVLLIYQHMESTGSSQALVDFIEAANGYIDTDDPLSWDVENEQRAARVVAILADMPDRINAQARYEAWRAMLASQEIVSCAPAGSIGDVIAAISKDDPEFAHRIKGQVRFAMEQRLTQISRSLTGMNGVGIILKTFDMTLAIDISAFAVESGREHIIPDLNAAVSLHETLDALS